jgi:hypothetical protein
VVEVERRRKMSLRPRTSSRKSKWTVFKSLSKCATQTRNKHTDDWGNTSKLLCASFQLPAHFPTSVIFILNRKWRSLGRYSSLADSGHGV